MRAVAEIGALACVLYLGAVYLTYLAMLGWSAAEKTRSLGRRRFDRVEEALDSPLTIPVTIIAPVFDEAPVVVAAVRSFLAVQYPEHEVIVVNDGSGDDTLEVLRDAFELEAVERVIRRVVDHAPIRTVYRSRLDGRLVVVDKENGGKADALNAGLNLARYRYVCGVDGDTILVPTALLDGMRLVLGDPARIVGVTGHIAISGRPERALDADGKPAVVDRNPLLAYQHLDYLRSFFNNRLGWTRLNTMLCAVGAFMLWRRDVVEDLGGFSREFTCEDIELSFRVHERLRREGADYRVLSLPDTVGVTEGPNRVRSLVAQRERWQRVITETVIAYRRMLLNPRYGAVGMIGVPFFVLTEVAAPVFEALAVLLLAAGVALGAVAAKQMVLVTATIALLNAIFASIAVLLEDQTSRRYRLASLGWLLALAPLELVLYRPILLWARAKGTYRYLRGDHGWHKFQRNAR